jgi:GMP synthase (glutamine-hydrolysing)
MSVRRATAIRHVHFEDLGTFEPLLREQGFEIRYVDAVTDDLQAIDLDDSHLVFVLGGPIGVYEDALYPFIVDELALIERRLAAGRPIVGICLGAQLMARALGARVYASGVKEIGWSPLTLTEAGRNGPLGRLADVPVLHWHGDTFDLPEGATHLASTPLCRNQAFAYGATALGLQFHVEADGANFAHWLVGHAAEIAGAGLSVTSLRADTAELAPACAAQARLFLLEWLDQIGIAKAESSTRMRAAG